MGNDFMTSKFDDRLYALLIIIEGESGQYGSNLANNRKSKSKEHHIQNQKYF